VSWGRFHRESESLAASAESALRESDQERARELYLKAAALEEKALAALDMKKRRTVGITAVSAVALYYKAKAYREAETLACRWLSGPNLPDFAVLQIKELLQFLWADVAVGRDAIRFAPGDVLVSVRGGEVVHGGAPLDLIVRKVSEVEKLFYRVAEFLLEKPHRIRGEPSREIKDMARPWLFQAAPGSYQFMVRVQEPQQKDLFTETGAPQVSEVARTFLKIVRASADDPEGALPGLVPNPEYRKTFLRMTRNLAPSGKAFERIEMREATESSGHAVSLAAPVRKEINATLKKQRKPDGERKAEEVRGILRAVHLDQQWLEVADPQDPAKLTRIGKTSEVLDDIVGPMVNHMVVVETLVDRQGRHTFQDIQRDE